MITIDGSQGEGGRQILRTALTPHAHTNRQVLARFMDVPIAVQEIENRNVIVRVG